MNKGIARRLLSVLLAAIMIAALLPAAGLGENVTAATALSITTQPVNATVEVGDTATFTVAASGNGTLSAIGDLSTNYNGLRMGFDMSR